MSSRFIGILRVLRNHQAFRLLKHSLIYGFGNIVQKFLSIFLLPIYTRYLTPADYGILALLGILKMIVGTVTVCGLTNGISRYFHYTKQEKTSISEVIWSPFLFISFLSVLIFLPLGLASGMISRIILDSDQYRYLVHLTLIGIFIGNLSGVGRSILILQEKVITASCINIVGILVGVVSGLFFVVHLRRGVTGLVEAGLTASIFMSVPVLMLTMGRFKPAFSLTILKKELKYSLPLVGVIFTSLFIDSSDRYALKVFLPLSEVGLYNMGYNLGLAMMIVVGGFCSAWPPYYHKHNQNGEGQGLCDSVLKLYLLVTSICVFALSMASPMAYRLLTTEKFHQAFTVVPWIAISYMLKGIYVIFVMGILVENKTSWQLYLKIAAALANIAGNLLLIPAIGREAAALTTLVSYGILSMGTYLMTLRVNPIPNLSVRYIWGIIILSFAVSGNVVWIGKLPLYSYLFSVATLTLVFIGFLALISFREFKAILGRALDGV